MYNTYMPNKTISLPDDVLPIIDGLGMPFSTWVADQLRRHTMNQPTASLAEQLRADAELAGSERPSEEASRAVLARMDRSAPW